MEGEDESTRAYASVLPTRCLYPDARVRVVDAADAAGAADVVGGVVVVGDVVVADDVVVHVLHRCAFAAML